HYGWLPFVDNLLHEEQVKGVHIRSPQVPPVDVLDGQVAPQHLHKHLPELPRREVVQEGVDHRAEVEKRVSDGVQDNVGPQVGRRPPTDLIGHPAISRLARQKRKKTLTRRGGNR
uniref:Uncharacterized protein n=1 Tax=Paramormyrops kingsleyae TaxID=1676925 RepID=A0A3B3T6A6_9TELE